MGSLYLYVAQKEKSSPPLTVPRDHEVLIRGKNMGFYPKAGSDVYVSRMVKGKLLYRHRNQIDEYNRRIPREENPRAREHVIFAGCSFIYGEGLDNKDSLPVLFQKKNPEAQSYNLGLPGGGLHTLLRYPEVFPLKEIIRPASGYYLYFFLPQHMDRFLMRFNFLIWAHPLFAHYSIREGKLVDHGEVADTTKFFIARKAREFGLMRAIVALDPERYSEKELADFAIAVRLLKERIQRDLPQTKFRFVAHPLLAFDSSNEELLMRELRTQGVDILEVKERFEALKKERGVNIQDLSIQDDGHPTALNNELLTEVLTSAIDLSSDKARPE